MSSIMKVLLLLAVVACISRAQLPDKPGQQCLCGRISESIAKKNNIKDIQIYQPTNFCARLEIVVTLNTGLRICLNPKSKKVQKVMESIIKQKGSTGRPTVRPTILESSTNVPSTSSSSI